MLIAQGSFEIPDYVMDIVTKLKVIHLPQFNQLLPARWGVGTTFMGEENVLTYKLWYFKNVHAVAVARPRGGCWWSRSNSTISVTCLYLVRRIYRSYQNSTSELQACGGLSVSAAVPAWSAHDAENKL